VDVLERLRKRVIRVRKNIAATWVLHLDNAPSHTSLHVREFLAKHNVATLPQPPYSPDLAPADFLLFPRIKTTLKGRRFDRAWESRWKKCIDARGEYFEEY